MELNISIAWIMAVLLLSLRFGVVVYLAPNFAVSKIPPRILIMLVVGLSAGLLAVAQVQLIDIPNSTALIRAALSELLLGAILAFGLVASFAAFLLGGRIVDFQMGFGIASLLDPATHTEAPVIGTILNLLAVMVFYAMDLHHYLIRGLAFSVEMIPPGTWLGDFDVAVVIAHFGAMFVYAIAVVVPVILSIFILDVAMAVMARTMPQVNVFIVSLPLKIFTGLTVVALSLHTLPPLMNHLFEDMFLFWQAILGK